MDLNPIRLFTDDLVNAVVIAVKSRMLLPPKGMIEQKNDGRDRGEDSNVH